MMQLCSPYLSVVVELSPPLENPGANLQFRVVTSRIAQRMQSPSEMKRHVDMSRRG